MIVIALSDSNLKFAHEIGISKIQVRKAMLTLNGHAHFAAHFNAYR